MFMKAIAFNWSSWMPGLSTRSNPAPIQTCVPDDCKMCWPFNRRFLNRLVMLAHAQTEMSGDAHSHVMAWRLPGQPAERFLPLPPLCIIKVLMKKSFKMSTCAMGRVRGRIQRGARLLCLCNRKNLVGQHWASSRRMRNLRFRKWDLGKSVRWLTPE